MKQYNNIASSNSKIQYKKRDYYYKSSTSYFWKSIILKHFQTSSKY